VKRIKERKMSKLVQLSIIVVALFLMIAPMALANTIQGDTADGPQFLAQATPVPEEAETDEEGTDDGTGTTTEDQMVTESGTVTDTDALTSSLETDPDADVDVDVTTTGEGAEADVDATVTEGETDEAQADQDVLLPETGGIASPWPSYLLLAAGAVFVLVGILSLAFTRRSR
jgi:hypothetical protein